MRPAIFYAAAIKAVTAVKLTFLRAAKADSNGRRFALPENSFAPNCSSRDL